MKNNNIFSILFIIISMLAISACEKAEQQSSSKDDKTIISRTDDCDDCPVADCCCSISSTGSEIMLEICGATGNRLSTRPCGPISIPGLCNDIGSTFYHGTFSVGSGFGPQIFCVPEDATFLLNAISGSGTVSITCQHGQIGAQTITPTITGPNRYFFGTNSDCEVGVCP